MTDTPSRPPEKPAAPESATTETPVRPGIPEQAAGPTPPTGPVGPTGPTLPGRAGPAGPTRLPVAPPAPPASRGAAPGWNGLPAAPVAGWEWSNGWVPKPGIIPLRPLRVGEILAGSFALLRGYWRTILPITAVVALLTQIPTTLILNTMPQVQDLPAPSLTPSADPAADLRKNLNSLVGLIPAVGVTEVISIIGGTLATAVLILVVSRAVVGRPATFSEVWQEARPRLLQLLGLTGLIALVVGGVLAASLTPALLARSSGASDGALAGLTMLIIPGTAIALWLAISMILAAPALMLERQGIRAALARSFRLVRNSWWRILGITLIVLVLSLVVMAFIALPFTLSGTNADSLGTDAAASVPSLILSCIGAIIGTAVTLPVITGTTALLYMDQRIRREALDLDLATAAGVPGYSHDGR